MKKFKRAYLRQWLGYTDFMGETGRGDFWRAIAVNAVILAALALLVFLDYRRRSVKEFGGLSGDLAGWFLQRAELWMLAGLWAVTWREAMG